MGRDTPGAACLPAEHVWQVAELVAPVVCDALPGAQGVHAAAPEALENFPTAHSV